MFFCTVYFVMMRGGHDSISIMKKSFIALSSVGFVLCSLSVLFLFGVFHISDTLVLKNVRYIQNFFLDGQLVSMMFWTVFSLLGGYLWMSTLFRSRSVTELVVTSLSLSALMISLSVTFSGIFFQIDELYIGILTEFALLSLAAFVFIGFLSRILREIVSSGVASIGIGKK